MNIPNNKKGQTKKAAIDLIKSINTEISSMDSLTHAEVLSVILKVLEPIDFVQKIYPESVDLINEYYRILNAEETPELYDSLNVPKDDKYSSRVEEIEALLKAYKKCIKEKHVVVTIITEILQVAKNNKLDLCQRYNYVYVYNGEFWNQLDQKNLAHFLGIASIQLGHPPIESIYHKFKDELIKQFNSQAYIELPEVDTKKVAINLRNGTFDFENGVGQLRAFKKEDFITYQLPFNYDKEATCPRFKQYLDRVLPDIEIQMILQEFSGYIFSNLKLEKCLLLNGSGANGKSVFFYILTSLLGKENTLTYTLGQFNHEYNRSKLTNVLLNYSSEKGADLNVEIFKALVSGEPIHAREPYGSPFTLYNNVKFIMNCNELPKEIESTEAYFRRLLIIPFEQTIQEEEKDIHLGENIVQNELSGVFNWVLEGLERLMRNQNFTKNEKVEAAIESFKKQSDSIALFIEEYGYRTSGSFKTALSELYRTYDEFCKQDGYKSFGKNNFSRKLELKGFESCRMNDGTKAFFITK